MRTYKFTMANTYYYYGYPQSKRILEIEGSYVKCTLVHYGNQGYDAPVIKCKTSQKCNGYFWELNALMRDLYKERDSVIRKTEFGLKEDGFATITIEG